MRDEVRPRLKRSWSVLMSRVVIYISLFFGVKKRALKRAGWMNKRVKGLGRYGMLFNYQFARTVEEYVSLNVCIRRQRGEGKEGRQIMAIRN